MPTRTLSGSSSQTSDATDSDSIAEEAASAGTAPSTAGIFELDADSAAGAGTGSESEDSSPAPSGRLVTEAGMSATAQCQNPAAVGASGS